MHLGTFPPVSADDAAVPPTLSRPLLRVSPFSVAWVRARRPGHLQSFEIFALARAMPPKHRGDRVLFLAFFE